MMNSVCIKIKSKNRKFDFYKLKSSKTKVDRLLIPTFEHKIELL
jgi:hypothetical protein